MFQRKEKQLRRRVALRVKAQRAQRKLTMKQAAELAALHARHWLKVEQGEVNLTLATLSKIGEALGIDPAALLGD